MAETAQRLSSAARRMTLLDRNNDGAHLEAKIGLIPAGRLQRVLGGRYATDCTCSLFYGAQATAAHCIRAKKASGLSDQA